MTMNDAEAAAAEEFDEREAAADSAAATARHFANISSAAGGTSGKPTLEDVEAVNAVLRSEAALTADAAMAILDLDVLLQRTPTDSKIAMTLTESLSRIPAELAVGDRVRSLAFTVAMRSPSRSLLESELQVVNIVVPEGTPAMSPADATNGTHLVLGRGIEWEVVRVESRDGQTKVTATVVDVTAAPVTLPDDAAFLDAEVMPARLPNALELACKALTNDPGSGSLARSLFWAFAASEVFLPSPTPVFDGSDPTGQVRLSLNGETCVAVFTHPDRLEAFQDDMHPVPVDGLRALRSVPSELGLIVNPGSDRTVLLRAAAVTAFLEVIAEL
ncbi:SseB family protein [Leucobacter sp. cx-169]|uniref:SseB family protein n=1 Tax=Leucobacter sp. cx-169 TaxID=2770549 RepID=UPI00165E3E0F|nr:SseB family protein [Leucobacter sp. cx-169]MBC9927393.1 SseB family protein [Leucobacter sp. cx-169]